MEQIVLTLIFLFLGALVFVFYNHCLHENISKNKRQHYFMLQSAFRAFIVIIYTMLWGKHSRLCQRITVDSIKRKGRKACPAAVLFFMTCYLSNQAENIFILSCLVSMNAIARNSIIFMIRNNQQQQYIYIYSITARYFLILLIKRKLILNYFMYIQMLHKSNKIWPFFSSRRQILLYRYT